MCVTKKTGIFIIVDLFIALVSFALSILNINSPEFVFAYSVMAYLVMIFTLYAKHRKWFTFDIIYIVVTFIFYFGQYIELVFAGTVQNNSLNITSSYNIEYTNKIAMYVIAYVAIMHSAFMLYRSKGKNKERIINLDYNKGRLIAWCIYLFSLPFGCYYEYTRAVYSSIYGYGTTLYADLADTSSLLRLSEFISGFVISMFILLLILEEKRRAKWFLMLSIIPYLILYISAGSRLQVGLLAITMAFVYKCWYRNGRKIELKGIILTAVVALVVIYLFALMASVRNYLGLHTSFVAALKEASANVSIADSILHAFDEFGCQIVSIATVFKNCPKNVGYNCGKLFLYGFEIIIPNLFGYQRIFYTDNTDMAFKAFLNHGNTGLGSSFISESYYCFGFLGIFVVFLLGLLMEHVTCKLKNIRDLRPYKAFSYFYLVYLLTFTVRSDMFVMPSSYFQYCFFPILIIWLTKKIRFRVKL